VFLLFGIQNPNSKSKLLSNLSLKKWRSIIRNLLTALLPTVNSTLQQTTLFLNGLQFSVLKKGKN
jgi:hypothetical protein